jgi:hypothetical protein
MSSMHSPRQRDIADRVAGQRAESASPEVRALVAGVSGYERKRMLPLLEAIDRRATTGAYMFTDRQDVSVWEREGEPGQYGAPYKPGLEASFQNDMFAARNVFQRNGGEGQFDAFVSKAQRTFLERRKSEEAVIQGDTVSELLDYIDTSADTKHLSKELTTASEWLKAQRKADIANQPFFKRMGARFQRFRQFLGNDHPIERIDVMAQVVASLNAAGPREELTGSQVLQALKQAYPQAFMLPDNAVLPPTPEAN